MSEQQRDFALRTGALLSAIYGHILVRLLIPFLLLSPGTAASGQTGERVPLIGLEGQDLDACHSVGRVTGLNPKADNYLTVRVNPSASGREKDRLGPGRELWICEDSGDWLGVVYGETQGEGAGDCGVGTPAARPRPYPGPCRFGWVHSRYVVVIAG